MSERNGPPGEKPDVAQLRAEIRQTRAELGETVQALAAKADVKARAREQVELTKQRVLAQAAEATERMRDVAQLATGRVRETADRAAVQVRDSGALEKAQDAREQVRRNPLPVGAVVAAAVLVVGLILVMRGRRR